MKNTTVRFNHGGGDILSLLEVRTALHLRPIAALLGQLLFDLRVQVVRSDCREEHPIRIERLWMVDFDGAPLRAQRRFDVQVEVLRAVDASHAARAVSPVGKTRRRHHSGVFVQAAS